MEELDYIIGRQKHKKTVKNRAIGSGDNQYREVIGSGQSTV